MNKGDELSVLRKKFSKLDLFGKSGALLGKKESRCTRHASCARIGSTRSKLHFPIRENQPFSIIERLV